MPPPPPEPTPLPNDKITTIVTFDEPGLYEYTLLSDATGAVLDSLEIWALGAGGGSAYGIGGAGAYLNVLIPGSQLPGLTGTFHIVVGEGGSVPHG